MAELTTKQRDRMAKSEFAIPGKRAYPLNDKNHARNALARVSQHGSPAEKAKVRAAVKSKFPSIGEKESKVKMAAMSPSLPKGRGKERR